MNQATSRPRRLLEICCDSVAAAHYAEKGGADRLELCENLAQGGVTPSAGKIKLVKAGVAIPVFVLIRPRKGDFLYTDEEFAVMLADIQMAKDLGADGIVSGALLANGQIDQKRTAQLLAAAAPLPFTFHRAIDVCRDILEGLDQLLALGVTRVLTSGGAPSALAGLSTLSAMTTQADGKVQLLVGGGVRPNSLAELLTIPQLTEFHSSASTSVRSQMAYRKLTPMGREAADTEFTWKSVDEEMVREMRKLLDA